MKKHILLLFLAFVFTFGTIPASGYAEEYESYTPEFQQLYSDVSPKHWAFESIATCSQRDWFSGYPDGTFKPANQIRRDEAAKVFAVALGLPIKKSPATTYTDTKSNWAKAYIEAAKGLFPGTTNLAGTESFRPEQTITREETVYALVVAWRYASKTANADLSVLNMFPDENSISEAVKPYAAVAVSEGLISGIPDGKGGSTIQGQTGLSRAEFATLLARALSHGYGSDSPYLIEETAPEDTPQPPPDDTPAPTPSEPLQPEPCEPPEPSARPEPEQPPISSPTPEEVDQQILALVNQYRAKAGAEPLTLGNKICKAAKIRANELEISFSHTRPDGRSCFSVFGEVELNFIGSMGENIAMGYRSVEAVMDGWMNSPGHRANILNTSYSVLGVGHYVDDSGVMHWVQMFAGT